MYARDPLDKGVYKNDQISKPLSKRMQYVGPKISLKHGASVAQNYITMDNCRINSKY